MFIVNRVAGRVSTIFAVLSGYTLAAWYFGSGPPTATECAIWTGLGLVTLAVWAATLEKE